MKIVHIFVKENLEGLHSIQNKNERLCEFHRLFELWHDYQYLFNFCKQNEKHIFTPFWGVSKLEEFVDMVIDEVYELENVFYDYGNYGLYDGSIILDYIFRPLNDLEYSLPVLQQAKAKASYDGYFKKPKLRLYALRIDKNTFVITGGCVKTTHKMEENAYTTFELSKLRIAREFLRANNYTTLDDLSYYYEQENQ